MIQKIFEGIANTIIKHPKLVAVFVLALFCVGLYGMTTLSMQTRFETYAAKDTPAGALQVNIMRISHQVRSSLLSKQVIR